MMTGAHLCDSAAECISTSCAQCSMLDMASVFAVWQAATKAVLDEAGQQSTEKRPFGVVCRILQSSLEQVPYTYVRQKP